jgi:hypothetical protein
MSNPLLKKVIIFFLSFGPSNLTNDGVLSAWFKRLVAKPTLRWVV